jgi:hypothetical protein
MSSDDLGLIVEFKAKYDSVTAGFNSIAKGSEQVVATNKKTEASFADLGTQAKTSLDTILNRWLGLGIALSGAGLFEIFNKTAESIENLTNKAKGLGIDSDSFEKLAYGAKQSGVDVDSLGDSIKKFNISLGQALSGNQTVIDSFKALGVNVQDLKGKDIADQYATVATAAGKLKDGNIAASESMAVFGRNYTQALLLGRDGIQQNIKGFDDLNVKLTDVQRESVRVFTDSKVKLDTLFEGFLQKVTADVSPAFAELISGVNKWVEANGGIDAVSTNVANKIVEIVQTSIDIFKALEPVFSTMFTGLGLIVDRAKLVLESVKGAANSYSDNLSQGNTNAHGADPGVSDFAFDFTGAGKSGWDAVFTRLENLIHPYSVENDATKNYNPNNFPGVSGIGAGRSVIPGFGAGPNASTNPYDGAPTTAAQLASSALGGFNTAIGKTTKNIGDMGDVIQKSNDMITSSFKALENKDTAAEVGKIFGIVGNTGTPNPDDPTQDFEKQAADLVQQLKDAGAGGIDTSLFNTEIDNLVKTQIADVNAGFNTQGFDGAIAEIKKYAESLGQKTQQVEVGITVTPTKDFTVKVFTNKDAAPYIAAAVAGAITDAAATGALT